MERARHIYYLTAVTWQRTHRRFRRLPLVVQAMVRHPFLTVAPLLIIILLVTAVFTPSATMESPTMHIIPTEVAP